MKLTVFISSAILAYSAVAVPVSSSPSENYSREIQKHEVEDLPPISTFVTPGGFIEPVPEYRQETTKTGLPFNTHPDNLEDFPTIVNDIPGDGPKNQTNTTLSAQDSYQSTELLLPGNYNYTDLRDLLDQFFTAKYRHAEKHSKRSDPQADKLVGLIPRLDVLNSTQSLDDKMAEIIIEHLEACLRDYRTNGWKYNSPQVEATAIHKAEDRLRLLNVTRDATLRHGEKLRDFCYQLDGSRHCQESCAREAMGKGTVSRPSWNSTAGLGKRAVDADASRDVSASQTTEEAPPSPTSQPSSVESSVSQFTMLVNCPGESGWKLAAQVSDISDCARFYRVSNADNKLERRQDDPAWLDKFLSSQYDNSLPKREGGNWEVDMSMEFENPKTHETADVDVDVDVEANWFSEWKRALAESGEDAPVSHTNDTDNASHDILRTSHTIESLAQLVELWVMEAVLASQKNGTDSEKALGEFAPEHKNGAAHSSAKQPVKRDIADQVRKLENEIGTEITEPFIKLKNATEDATDSIQDAVERFAARVQKHKSHASGKLNYTATFDPSNYRKRDLSESVKKAEDEIAAKVREGYKVITAPVIGLENSTHKATGVVLIPERYNSTARFNTSKSHKRGLPESVRKFENEIGSKITEPYDKITKPFTQLKNSTARGLHQLAHKAEIVTTHHPSGKDSSPAIETNDFEKGFAELYKTESFRDYIHKLFNQTSNSTSCPRPGSYDKNATHGTSTSTCAGCPRIHPKDIKPSRKDSSTRATSKECYKYGPTIPAQEFSQRNGSWQFNRLVNKMVAKHEADDHKYDEHWLSKDEQEALMVELGRQYDAAGYEEQLRPKKVSSTP